MFSFFTYALSSAGQARLGAANYAPLSGSLVDTLRGGFQGNF
jgi:hypothetical protein